MDAFYASVEQRDFPEYRNKPIAVGGSPDGRGVVATCSYEARKYGVHSAMPSAKALRLCPHLIFIRPRFDLYRKISRQIKEIYYDYTERVEPLSLDEAYLDVTQNKMEIPSGTLIAREIKQKIKEETGLTASAGVSYCKFLAKLASDLDKPDGLAVIEPEEAQEFIDQLDIGEFHGIGSATEEKMHYLNIFTGADLKKKSEYELVNHFGKQGLFFYKIARGIDKRRVKPDRIRKSVGKERTFSEDVESLDWIRQFLKELNTKVVKALKKSGAKGKTITLKIRHANFETFTRSHTLPHYTDNESDIYDIVEKLVAESELGTVKVRLLGITVSNLNLQSDGLGKQLTLPFDD